MQVKTRVDMSGLKKVAANISNFRSALTLVGHYMVKSIIRNFQAQGRPQKWKPLSPYTLAMRKKGRGRGHPKILEDTGRLRQSIGFAIKDDSVAIGTNLEYAKKLQEGGTAKIPARTIIAVKKKALKFEKAGRTIIVKKVYQPARTAQIPARPYVMFQVPEDIDKIRMIFIRKLKQDIQIS